MLRTISVCFFVVIGACNGGSRLFEGANAKKEAKIDNADDTADDDSEVASEPVAIAGASLVCQYKPGQQQGSSQYQLDCGIVPESVVKNTISKVEFYKVNAKDERTLLTIDQEDLASLKWTLLETPGTLSDEVVEGVLHASGYLPVTLRTTVTKGVPLNPAPDFWLGGEPTNSTVPGTSNGEDCVEFANRAEKIDRQNFTGLVTGPYGRLNDVNCSRSLNFLCRNGHVGNSPKWIVSNFKGPWQENANACPEGYSFGAAATEAEVAEVSAIVDSNPAIFKIWVNMSDASNEGVFVTHF